MPQYRINGVDVCLSENPPKHDAQFVVMISGLHSVNTGKYWNSLLGQGFVVVQPKFWQLWKRSNQSRLKSVFDHLLTTYKVKGGKFVLHGYSNGTSGVLNFACEYPQLCCGIVIVAAIGIQPYDRLHKLSGIPIAHYWGDRDHKFHPSNLTLKRHLEQKHHHKPYHVVCMKGIGHEDNTGVLKPGGKLHGDVIGSIQNMFKNTPRPSPHTSRCAICGSACKLGLRQVYGRWCCEEGTSCRANYMNARRSAEKRFNGNERKVRAACVEYITNKGKNPPRVSWSSCREVIKSIFKKKR